MQRRTRWLPALAVAVALACAAAASAAPDPSLFAALRQGGFVVVFRHAATNQEQEDRIPVDLADCATQRTLSARGRAQARAIGAGFRARRLPVKTVLASPYCRTKQTAMLAFGRATPTRALLLTGDERGGAIRRQVERFRRLIATRPPHGTLTVLVTHTYLIKRVLGLELEEGDAAVVLPRGEGRFTMAAVLRPGEWQPG